MYVKNHGHEKKKKKQKKNPPMKKNLAEEKPVVYRKGSGLRGTRAPSPKKGKRRGECSKKSPPAFLKKEERILKLGGEQA